VRPIDASSLARREKAGIRAAGANFKTDPLRTAWAIADVGGAIAVGVDAGVDLAASKMDT